MFIELAFLAAGVAPGHALRQNKSAHKVVNFGIMFTIYALLFILGAKLGGNEQLYNALGQIGLQGLTLGFACTVGSALAMCLAKKTFTEQVKPQNSGPGNLRKGMSGSFIILCCMIVGIFASRLNLLPVTAHTGNLFLYILWSMLFFVGISVGFDLSSLRSMRSFWPRVMLIPVLTIAGTTVGACLSALFLDMDVRSCLAVGSGFGYYSLASVITTEMSGEMLGSISLIANIFRELFCLLTIPLIARFLGPLSAVAAAGAPAMDTCLPVIARFTSEHFAIIALCNGLIITILVPIFIPVVLEIFI